MVGLWATRALTHRRVRDRADDSRVEARVTSVAEDSNDGG